MISARSVASRISQIPRMDDIQAFLQSGLAEANQQTHRLNRLHCDLQFLSVLGRDAVNPLLRQSGRGTGIQRRHPPDPLQARSGSKSNLVKALPIVSASPA